MTEKTSADRYILWGGALSLFTGKVRSYLIKKGISYREFYASHPEFNERIRPIVRLGVTPILETPGGDVLQDSTEIIDFLERSMPANPMIPNTPVQRTVARLIDAYGTTHLQLAAMHFRWSEPYLSEQRAFLDAEFGRVSLITDDRAARNAAGARMIAYFGGMLPAIGCNADTVPGIEAAYFDLLECLDVHFQHVPYLLGGHPTIADFGMMAPLFAHLGRDPAPARLMALRAPNVMRWTERMNLAVIEDAEFPHIQPAFMDDDAIPPTLEPILALIFRDWTPELKASAECFNHWVNDSDRHIPSGHLVSLDGKRRVHPTLGPIEYALRGVTIRRPCAPQMLWHFDKASAEMRHSDAVALDRLTALMRRVGGIEAMRLQLARPIVRQDYVLTVG